MKQILDDDRKIESIWYEQGEPYKIGTCGVTKIEAYGEPAEFCDRPWFAIWKGDVITSRMNGAQIEGISYYQEPR